jgi:GTP pyrophosphokinase
VRFDENPDFVYPVRIQIRGVDRYHLLIDLVNCITEEQHLYMTGLETETVDRIASCTIDFLIHSVSELQTTIDSILRIKGIDEVNRLDIE